MTPLITELTRAEWQALQGRLYERDDRLDFRQSGQTYAPAEAVDAYALSAHAEALQSGEVDGDLWGTLEDIDESAASEQEAWDKIKAFYFARGCVLVRVSGSDEDTNEDTDELEEWIFTDDLARHLGLLAE